MAFKPYTTGPKTRNPNQEPLDQGYLINKMDRLDRYVDKHSMQLYLESLK